MPDRRPRQPLRFPGPGRIRQRPGPNRTARQCRPENGGRSGRSAGNSRRPFPIGLRRRRIRRGAAKDGCCRFHAQRVLDRRACSTRAAAASLAEEIRAGARHSVAPAGRANLPRSIGACGDRAGGIGPNDVPLQMAHPAGICGKGAWPRCWRLRNGRHGQHGRNL